MREDTLISETEERDTRGAVEDDPHASKISPDDPRLSIQRPRSRVLKLTPVIATLGLLVGVGATVIFTGVRKSDKKVGLAPEPARNPARPSAIPAFLQEMPDVPAPVRPATAPPRPVEPPAAVPLAPPKFEPLRPDPPVEHELARRAQLEDEARTSGLFFDSGSRPTGVPAPSGGMLGGASSGSIGPPGMPVSTAQSPAEGFDPNLQGRKNAFLDEPRSYSDYLSSTPQRPLSPYEVKATTIIPAALITGINSDLPGPIIAQVREQVYDTVTGQHLLIPQGARLFGAYDSMIAWGQERVLMCWNRLIFPNGSSIDLHCMPAADLKGQAGLTDEVDQHLDRLLAAVGLSTVLSLGAQAAAGDPTGYQPTLAQSAARNAAGQINAAGQGMVQRQANLQPTITVRPGFDVNVLVTKDLVLKPYVD